VNNQLTAPIRFSPSLERPDVNEAETTQGLIATMRYITEKTLADGGHANDEKSIFHLLIACYSVLDRVD
jgi:hypothetical protein